MVAINYFQGQNTRQSRVSNSGLFTKLVFLPYVKLYWAKSKRIQTNIKN